MKIDGRVLVIAGSDSGGGAGIQADIKTISALGAYAATALTAVTVQNTQGVFGVHDVPAQTVADQIRVVIEDIGADCIKTGMLHTAEVIDTVARALAETAPDIPLVLDPVMVAKGGASLLEPEAVAVLRDSLLPRAAVVTPNIPEAAALTGESIATVDDMKTAAAAIRRMGARAVYLKGGHLPSETITDVFMGDGFEAVFESPRIATPHTHGTGCTLASALATGIAQGMDLGEAARRAHDYVQKAIETAPGFGAGHGPLNHLHTVAPFDSSGTQES